MAGRLLVRRQVSFGDATLDNIVVMYPIDDPVFIVIRCFLVGSVSSALVAHLFPARNTLLSLFSLPPTFFYRVTITGLYVALCTFSAIGSRTCITRWISAQEIS